MMSALYQSVTFLVIASACKFDLLQLAKWLAVIGYGVLHVGIRLVVGIHAWICHCRSSNQHERERSLIRSIFVGLLGTDNSLLVYVVRPTAEQRVGGAEVAQTIGRVGSYFNFLRFFFSEVEQSALQLAFVLFYDVVPRSDRIWLTAAGVATMSMSFMSAVERFPEVREDGWKNCLAQLPGGQCWTALRMLWLLVFLFLYRTFLAIPWFSVCIPSGVLSGDVYNHVFIGICICSVGVWLSAGVAVLLLMTRKCDEETVDVIDVIDEDKSKLVAMALEETKPQLLNTEAVRHLKNLNDSSDFGKDVQTKAVVGEVPHKDVDVSSETTKDTGGDHQSESVASQPQHVWVNGRSGTIAWDGRSQNMQFVTIRWVDTGETSDLVRVDDLEFREGEKTSSSEFALLHEVVGPGDFDLEAAVFGDEATDAFLSPLVDSCEPDASGNVVAMDGSGSENSDDDDNQPLDLEL